MTTLIPENIRELLTKYAFVIELDNYDENLICKICKKLMLDVYQSHCGCNYCYQCISDYLNGEDKLCPGQNEECKLEHLIFQGNLTRNARLNRKILQIKVRCPYEYCLCFFTLGEMEKHMRLCDKQDRECPYVNIGCEDGGGLCKDKIMDHLHNEVFTHSKLLIELVENMRNDVNSLKLEIVSLKEESQRKEMEMERQSREIEGLKEEMEIKQMQTEAQNKEIENMKKELINKEEQSSDANGFNQPVKGGAFDVQNDNPFGVGASEGINRVRFKDTWIVSQFKGEYDEIFKSLKPTNGKLSGTAARDFMVKTKLPYNILGKIWKLSDIDQDGWLDDEEFALVSYLVRVKLDGDEIPNTLPLHLIPPSKRDMVPADVIPE